MEAILLRDADDNPFPATVKADETVRLSVNCFVVTSPDGRSTLIDCGAGGSWEPTMGRIEKVMKTAGIDPASITTMAATHAHEDHVSGLLTPHGHPLLPKLEAIVIGEGAVKGFLGKSHLAVFRPLLRPVRDGDRLEGGLQVVALPGHAPGHIGYALKTDEDDFLFFGDVVHVPALLFADPTVSWGYDDDQPAARATRATVLQQAASQGTWIAGAHLGRPGIGRVTSKDPSYVYEPAI